MNSLKTILRSVALVLLACGLLEASTVPVYLVAGQSNANATWASAIEAKLRELTGSTNVVVVHSQHSGEWLQAWYTTSTQANYYDDYFAVNNAFNAIQARGDNPIFKGLFWFQGEADTGSYAEMDLYANRFRAMLAQMQIDLRLSLPIKYTIMIIDANPDPYYNTPANLDGRTRAKVEYMRSVLFALGADVNGTFVDTRGYARADGWHLQPSEHIRLGIAAAEKHFLQFITGNYTTEFVHTTLNDGVFAMRFEAPAHIQSWQVAGSTNLGRFNLRLTHLATLTEISPGQYQVEIAVTSTPARFFRIEAP